MSNPKRLDVHEEKRPEFKLAMSRLARIAFGDEATVDEAGELGYNIDDRFRPPRRVRKQIRLEAGKLLANRLALLEARVEDVMARIDRLES